MRAAALLMILVAPCLATSTIDVAGGVFFEAEAFDGYLGDPGFGSVMDEPLGSGGQVLLGMYKSGLLGYRITIPADGTWSVWLRAAAPGNVTEPWGFDHFDAAALQTGDVPLTNKDLSAPDAYQWSKLGSAEAAGGDRLFVLGQGALRPDCFWLTPDPAAEARDALLASIAAEKAKPKGQLLPELRHDRTITTHPGWLKHALRPAYAHFEWDPENTPESWAKMAAASGADCLFGAGEMPTGTVDGKLAKFGYDRLRDPDFKFPPNFDLSYSWVKDYVDAAHAEGLQFVVYGGAFRTLDPLLVEHPEWRQQDAAGRPFGSGFGSWCSPYRQAYIDRWAQVATSSGFDGIMIDMLFTGPTGGDYSRWTVDAFKARFGVEPPRDPDPRNLTWQRWIDFQNWNREEMLLDLTEALHQVSPEIAVVINQTEGWIFGRTDSNFLTSRVAHCVDGLLEEMGWEYRHADRGERPWAWPLMGAWQNLYLHCRTRPGGYGQMWHVSLNYPPVHAAALSYTMLANGVAPGVVTGGNWPVMEDVWAHTKACQPWVDEAELVPWAAIHYGEDTENWYASAGGDEQQVAWLKNVFGIFQAALELHLPVAIVTDDDLADPEALGRYRCLVLPNSACLSDAQADSIRAYVAGGGGLVATYETGRYDEHGTLRDRPALADVLGAVAGNPVMGTNWLLPLPEATLRLLQHPDIQNSGIWRQGISDPAPQGQLYTGPAARSIGAVPVMDLDPEAETVRLGGATVKGARLETIIARTVGQGRVVYLPLDIGQAYYVFNQPLGRRLIGQAIEQAAGTPPPLRTDALMAVETVLYRSDDALLVHLLNDNSSFGRAAAPNAEAFTAFRDEVNPVDDTAVTVAGRFSKATLLPDGVNLPVTQADGWSTVMVPRIRIHGLVVFEP